MLTVDQIMQILERLLEQKFAIVFVLRQHTAVVAFTKPGYFDFRSDPTSN